MSQDGSFLDILLMESPQFSFFSPCLSSFSEDPLAPLKS